MSTLNLRIDWADLDLFGHVNNVAFFKYMQASRLHYCESIGLTSLNEKGKLSFMVANSHCNFKKPILYPGQVKVVTQLSWTKNTSFELKHTLFNQADEIAAEGADVLVLFDYENKTKVNIPNDLKLKMEGNVLRG